LPEDAVQKIERVPASEIPTRWPTAKWQKVIDQLPEVDDDQALKITLIDGLDYERARSGLYKAAKRLGVVVSVSRNGTREIYVRRVQDRRKRGN
jgi:hypothetical protein